MRCLKHISKLLLGGVLLLSSCMPAYAVLPTIFATQPSGNVAASLLDQNYTFLESQGVQGLVTTGGSNAYVATPQDAWITGYTSYVGRALTVIPNFTNSASATVNVSGLGAASLYKNANGIATALASGDMVSGVPAILICDGTGFLLANPTPASGGGGGGAMVLLNTQIISTSTPAIMDTTDITSAYTHYIWEISNLTSVTNGTDAYITIQQGGLFLSTGYHSNNITSATDGSLNGSVDDSTTFFVVSDGSGHIQNTSTSPSTVKFEFWNPSVSGNLSVMFNSTTHASGPPAYNTGGGFNAGTAPTTGIKMIVSSGNIGTAIAKLYGIQ